MSATSTGAKNRVDRRVGDCRQRWSLACRASDSVETKARRTTVRIADVGAGLLSMLELVLDGGGEGDQTKPGLLASVNERLRSGDVASDGDVETVAEVEYFADEVNASLLLRCEEKLIDMGFGPVEDSSDRSFV